MAKSKEAGGREPEPQRSAQPDANLSLDELDTLIAETLLEVERLQARVASLRRIKKAKLGGIASALAARERRFTDEMIRKAYEAGRGEGYGGVRDAATTLGCSEQTVHRWLARSLRAGGSSPKQS